MGHHGLWIGELAENKGILLIGNAFCSSHGAAHAFFRRGEHKLCAQRPQQVAALNAHGFGHGQYAAKATHRGNQSHANAHITAGGLHQHTARFNAPFFQSFANGRLAGRSLNEITAQYINSMAFTLGEHTDIFAPLLAAIYELCREACEGALYRSGTGNLLEHPELRNVADRLYRLLDSREEMLRIIGSRENDLFVSVGRENARPEMENSSMIVARYRIGEDSIGALGLVGPVRMDYARLIPHVEYFAGMLSRMLSDTLNNGL